MIAFVLNICLQIHTLADQLKYFDPTFERNLYEPISSGDVDDGQEASPIQSEDQEWLQQLSGTLNQLKVRNVYKYLSYN